MHLQVPRRGLRAGSPLTRLGILGGTFNPPHVGHLVCAQEARAALDLSEVVLMPVSAPPHKEAPEDPGAGVRVEMCELAAAGEEGLSLSRLEVERGGPSYTADTLRELRERRPGDELVWIVGGDMASSLARWREPAEVLRLATLAVAERGDDRRARIAAALAEVPGGDAAEFFDMPRLDVSSSEVRRRVAERRPIRHLVPDAVVEYIEAHGLYRAAVAAR